MPTQTERGNEMPETKWTHNQLVCVAVRSSCQFQLISCCTLDHNTQNLYSEGLHLWTMTWNIQSLYQKGKVKILQAQVLCAFLKYHDVPLALHSVMCAVNHLNNMGAFLQPLIKKEVG